MVIYVYKMEVLNVKTITDVFITSYCLLLGQNRFSCYIQYGLCLAVYHESMDDIRLACVGQLN